MPIEQVLSILPHDSLELEKPGGSGTILLLKGLMGTVGTIGGHLSLDRR